MEIVNNEGKKNPNMSKYALQSVVKECFQILMSFYARLIDRKRRLNRRAVS